MIHTGKGFSIVNETEVDVFLEISCFSMIQWMSVIWSLVPLPFLNPAWTSGISWFLYCWSLAWRILSITLLACEMSAIVYINWDYSVLKRLFLSSYCQDPRTCSDFCPLWTCVFCFPFSSVTYLHILNKYLLGYWSWFLLLAIEVVYLSHIPSDYYTKIPK